MQTGEIAPVDTAKVTASLITLLIGLTDAVAGDVKAQAQAIAATKSLLDCD